MRCSLHKPQLEKWTNNAKTFCVLRHRNREFYSSQDILRKEISARQRIGRSTVDAPPNWSATICLSDLSDSHVVADSPGERILIQRKVERKIVPSELYVNNAKAP